MSPVILLDAGHGIDTPGKRSPDGRFREYKYNREIAEAVQARLLEEGFDARQVVPETNDIALRTRAMRVNKVCKAEPSVLLLTIHSNAAGNGSRWMGAVGWSVYTTRGETKADKLATKMWDAFADEFPDRKMRRDMTDGDPDIEADFYIIRNTACPAVLLENFFYDNAEECAWLLLPSTRGRIVSAIVDGIHRYLGR